MEKDSLYHKKYDLLQFCAGETFKTILADPQSTYSVSEQDGQNGAGA